MSIAGSGTSVLVVDDNSENRALARATLEDEGYHVVLARGGEEAVTTAATEYPGCILMDVRMPNVDGLSACRWIRAMPGGSEIAIVFVTAERDVETFDRTIAAGGDDFITKPFRPAELLVRVQTALRLRKLTSERSELFEELKHERERLQRLELQKEQLVGFLIHDLKNPVNAIELQAQLLERRSEDPERSRVAALKIQDETHTLLRMITDLLDISRADEGRLAPVMREIDAVALVRTALEQLSDRAAAAGVMIETEIDAATLCADLGLISRVLLNLLDNAIRHAPEGTRVRVTLARIGSYIEIRVANAGPAIPADQRDAVFERFQSGGTASTTNRGLGMTFCKLAVEAHGGRIWIEDGYPGVVFCVTLAAVDQRT